MITIDFSLAISLFLFISILVVISHWIFYTSSRREKDKETDLQYLRQCPYCTYVFFDYGGDTVTVCPQCKSYIGAEEDEMKNNESGIVLVAVIALVIAISILAVGIISINSNQVLSHQHQIDRIKAVQLAKGVFWDQYMKEITGNNALADDDRTQLPSELLDKNFDIFITRAPAALIPGIDGTTPYLIEVEWVERP